MVEYIGGSLKVDLSTDTPDYLHPPLLSHGLLHDL